MKNRIGILLNFSGVLVCWSSKMQSEIAISTLESEHIVMSQGMRELMNPRRLCVGTRIKDGYGF